MDGLKDLVGRLRMIESERAECAGKIAQDGSLKERVVEAKPSVKVGAVDASIIAQEFHAFDLIITKTVGAVFEYKEGRLERHKYVPSPFPQEKVRANGSMDLMELNQFRNITRLGEEIETAIAVGDECDLLLIDGSLVPLPGDRPPQNKMLKQEYARLVGLYMELFRRHEGKLAGIVKDSRSKRLMEEHSSLVPEGLMENTTDSTLLDMVLEKGERSKTLAYSKDARGNAVLKDFAPYGERLNFTYMKAGKNDRPVRVEFFGDGKGVIESVYSLCSINENYSYPAVLIDVDLRAMVDPRQAERIYREIEIAPFLRDSRMLRRNSRPFR